MTPPHTPPEHATTATINEEYISAASDEDMYSDEEDEHGSVPMLIEKKQVSITSSSLSNEDDRGYGKIWNHNFINSFLPLISLHLAPTLTTLRLSRAQYDTDLLIPTLASLTLLTHLDLSYSSVRAPLLEYLAGGEENNNSRGLKCLDLSGCFTLRRHAAPLFTNILMNQGINGSLQILVARDNGADLDKRQVDWCLEEMRGQCKNKKIQVVL